MVFANATESGLKVIFIATPDPGGTMARWPIGLLPQLRVPAVAVIALGVLAPLLLTETTSEAAPSLGYVASNVPGVGETISLAVDPVSNTVYFAEPAANQVAVLNGATNSVINAISTDGSPEAVAVDPGTDTVYASVWSGSAANSVIDVIDGKTGTVTGSIGVASTALAFDSTTGTLAAVDADGSGVTFISGATNSVATTVSTGPTLLSEHIAVDGSTGVVWVLDDDGTLLGVSEATDSVTESVPIPGGTIGLAVNAATDTLYVSTDEDGLTVVDGATGTITTTIATGQLGGLAVDSSADVVYASSLAGFPGTTLIIDGTDNTVADVIHRGGYPDAFDSANGSVYECVYAVPAPEFGAWVITPSATNAMPPIIFSTAAASFTTGRADSFTVLANALPTATITESGVLPSGVTFSSGALTGTPAAGSGGSYPITFTASNGVAPDYSQSFDLTVDQPAVITSAATATFETGITGAFDLSATGYPTPTFLVDGSPEALPTGVSITQTAAGSWQLAGTPAPGTGGIYHFVLEASNRITSATQPFTITVDQPTAFVSATKASGRVGRRFRFVVRTTGFPVASLSEHGRLPKGISLQTRTNGTAVLEGTPARSDRYRTYGLRFIAANGNGAADSVTQTLRLRIA
jgi:large repetitive protein